MDTSLSVKEQTHKSWKIITAGSGVFCIIFAILFWNLTDPFWVSILRLCAFIFFAIAVLGILKLMNGPLEISLSSSDELVLVSYTKKNEVVKEEEFERQTIKKVTVAQPGGNPLVKYLSPHSSTFKISFTDTDRNLTLFEFSGRPLLFSETSQRKITDYFNNLGIQT